MGGDVNSRNAVKLCGMLSESNVVVGNAVRESCIGGDAGRAFGATLPRGFILVPQVKIHLAIALAVWKRQKWIDMIH